MTRKSVRYTAASPQSSKLPRYNITAINPLTGLREAVTPPCSKRTAARLLARLRKKPPDECSWICPKLENCSYQQLSLNF